MREARDGLRPKGRRAAVKLGLFTVVYQDRGLDEMLDAVEALGVKAIEIGVANYPRTTHLDELATDADVDRLMSRLARAGITISALSCQGNPLHPDAAIAEAHHQGWRRTVEWARRLGVGCVNVFSGCPGDGPDSRMPNWVTCAWPPEYARLVEWQWRERVIPYWQAEAAFAEEQGVSRIAFEMHPGFVVYNPATLLKLRQAVGPVVGANLDPSHLFWQGIDPIAAIQELCAHDALFHFHAKDVWMQEKLVSINGVLDYQPYERVDQRAWSFCTVGYGHGPLTWARIIQALRIGGYDGALSIEHEDAVASRDEGVRHAVNFLAPLLWTEPKPDVWWT